MSVKIKLKVDGDILSKLAWRMYSHLNDWQSRWSHQQFHRNRILHKPRQVGADWYFTLEALNDACLTGRNKIFIGDSNIIESDIDYLLMHFNEKFVSPFDLHRELAINKKFIIELDNGAIIYFISSEEPYLAGICGDVYVPEWSWNEDVRSVVLRALDLSKNNKWRRTFYSSRSEFDNGSTCGIDRNIFRDNKIFSELTYFDRVNFFESIKIDTPISNEVANTLAQLKEHMSPNQFMEMQMCKFQG
ncbi:terminase large subunit domain-containing protein [Providencia sp. PROV091]|uniref:terminase large subunit domain-containing protein n=1 Tax=Providencia sp. PROV091 TaxID=2949807 RepID=UPI00234B2D5C|nr:terminase family protein [Providencia sp. PROV091]